MWWSDSHLRRRLLGIQVSLSPTLGRNEKVEQHIKKKTHKPNALRFWVEGGVIPLYGLTLVSFLFEISPVFLLQILPTVLKSCFSVKVCQINY